MINVVGVRFRNAGKVYYFDPKEYHFKMGDHAIVETARGIEYGTVAGKVGEVPDEWVVQPLKPVIRIATPEDDAKAKRNREREREAIAICKEKILKHNLEMKLIDAEYTFDNSKVLFYFTADGRIDFRDLVKDLAAVFRTRIELRQIGVRDETKILGGIGICGRPLCCATYLSEFAPVSIKMAKEQNLSLNPTKISGVCGRLMCCLKNEQETYEYLNNQMPNIGDTVTTSTGLTGEVASVNVLRQKVKILIDVEDEKEIQEYDVADLTFKPRRKKEKSQNQEKGRDKEKKERGEKPEKGNNGERGEKPERINNGERGEKPEREEQALAENSQNAEGEERVPRKRNRNRNRNRGGEGSAERPSERSSERSGRPSERSADKTSERPSERSSERPSERRHDRHENHEHYRRKEHTRTNEKQEKSNEPSAETR